MKRRRHEAIAPKGDFSLYVRAYWPKPPITEGSWTPPPGKFLATFKDYPPSQRPSSFGIDQLVEKMRRSFESQ